MGQCRRVTANDVQFLDPIETARTLCTELRTQGAEFIIALTHCDNELDIAISSSVSDIDLIAGGLDTRYFASSNSHNAGIVKSGSNFEDFSKIRMTIQEGENRVKVHWPPLRYSVHPDFSGVEADNAVMDILKKRGNFDCLKKIRMLNCTLVYCRCE